MNIHPRHVVWDWNGTLLDDVDASLNAFNRLLADHRLPPVTRAGYLAHFGFPVRGYYTRCGFPPDLAPGQWQSIAESYHAYFNAEPAALFPDARAALARCAAIGLPQSILSALHHPLLLKTLDAHNLAPFFTHVRGAGDLHGSSKLRQGRQLLRDLALPPGEILLIGDTLHDAQIARELGMDCVLVSRGHQSPARLAAANVPVFPSLGFLFASSFGAVP